MEAMQRVRRSGVGVAPDRTVGHVARVMERSGIGLVAVVEDDRPIGVVTDRDIVRRAVAKDLSNDARIDTVMSMPVLTIPADCSIAEAHDAFRRHAVRRLVVVDGQRFVGVLSLDDVLVDIAANLTTLVAPLASEIAQPHRDSAPLVET